jgi:GNAT superfamily N-acetyltransferase
MAELLVNGAGRRMSDRIDVRAAASEDLAILERGLPLATPSRHRECLAQQAAGRLAYLVAWHEGSPVGHGLLHWPGPRDGGVRAQIPDCPEIFMLGVLAPLRSRGIGGLLLSGLEQLARDAGRARVGLGVALANPRARGLYERAGYADVGAPRYVDRWHWIDPSGRRRDEADPCVFLVKPLRAEAAAAGRIAR